MIWLVITGSIATGAILFVALMKILPKKLMNNNSLQVSAILQEASVQAEVVLQKFRERGDEEMNNAREELEIHINTRTEDLKALESELDSREQALGIEETRIKRLEKDLATQVEKTAGESACYNDSVSKLSEINAEILRNLEAHCEESGISLVQRCTEDLITNRRLECQKVLKMNDDELSTLAAKRGYRVLARSLSRYEPRFVWPKPNTLIELQNSSMAETLANDACRLLPDLRELASIEIEILSGSEMGKPAIKLAGGAGVDKEAVRLTLNELLGKGPDTWSKAAGFYAKHRELLDRKAISLGRQAADSLQIQPFHTEILKLIGYLNWRTSYRQNQYLHSVEVAQLAGIVAIELGEDPALAKRCGILHDIGKALDYRIEGSHAVISGDYADRFGEKKLICDTVMSHHNDLIVESPLAYILKTADTLSGARPGARVNLEEGYQTRLSAIDEVVNSFPGITRISIMNGAREVHVEVNNKKTKAEHLEELSKAIARKIETEVAFPGQIKVLVTRKFEAIAVA